MELQPSHIANGSSVGPASTPPHLTPQEQQILAEVRERVNEIILDYSRENSVILENSLWRNYAPLCIPEVMKEILRIRDHWRSEGGQRKVTLEGSGSMYVEKNIVMMSQGGEVTTAADANGSGGKAVVSKRSKYRRRKS